MSKASSPHSSVSSEPDWTDPVGQLEGGPGHKPHSVPLAVERARRLLAVEDGHLEYHPLAIEDAGTLVSLYEQFDALYAIAQRVADADNQRLAAEGEPGWEAMKEMEDALHALHVFVASNPADIPLTEEQIAKAQGEIQMRAEIHGSSPANVVEQPVTPGKEERLPSTAGDLPPSNPASRSDDE